MTTDIRAESVALLAAAVHLFLSDASGLGCRHGIAVQYDDGIRDRDDCEALAAEYIAASPTLARRLDLATAWEMAEAALPDEDLMLSLFTDTGQYEATDGRTRGYGPTPTEALLALAEKLKEATR